MIDPRVTRRRHRPMDRQGENLAFLTLGLGLVGWTVPPQGLPHSSPQGLVRLLGLRRHIGRDHPQQPREWWEPGTQPDLRNSCPIGTSSGALRASPKWRRLA